MDAMTCSPMKTAFLRHLTKITIAPRPTYLPENSNTEDVRMARAQALLAYASSRLGDEQEKEKALTAVAGWLNNERSGQVRDVLHEAHASFLKQGENGP